MERNIRNIFIVPTAVFTAGLFRMASTNRHETSLSLRNRKMSLKDQKC